MADKCQGCPDATLDGDVLWCDQFDSPCSPYTQAECDQPDEDEDDY